MLRRDSVLARNLEPLAALVWPLFFVWTAVVALLWITGLDEERLRTAIANPGLRAALVAVLRSADTIWLLLAAANLYVAAAERIGLTMARVWALVIFATAAVIAVASVRTGWPLGPVIYTTRLGMKLGPVPLGWLLWWFVVVIGGRMLAERLLPRASHAQLALTTGLLALLTHINFDPIAWKLRAFWLWDVPGGLSSTGLPLWRSYATWLLVPIALAFFLREREVTATAQPPAWRAALIMVLVNAVFLLTHAAIAIRG